MIFIKLYIVRKTAIRGYEWKDGNYRCHYSFIFISGAEPIEIFEFWEFSLKMQE